MVLGIILCVGLLFFIGVEVVGLVRDIKNKKKEKVSTADDVEKENEKK